MFSKSIALIGLQISLLLAAVGAWAQTPLDQLEERVKNAKDRPSLERVLDDIESSYPDEAWVDTARESTASYGYQVGKEQALAGLALERYEAQPTSIKLEDPKKEAEEILSSPAYRDAGVRENQEGSGWFERIIEQIIKAIINFLERLFPQGSGSAGMPMIAGLPAITFGIILALVLAAFVAFMIWRFGVVRNVRKKAGGLLDDDEPDRTADEWLVQADELTKQGEYRKAIRCLYLACLVRFDDANVAVFDRGQTNWEHLHRIMGSPRKPAGLDFRPPTKAFDLFWYGYAPCAAEDVAEFRGTYESLLQLLGMRKAA